jgi:hypothetical protein
VAALRRRRMHYGSAPNRYLHWMTLRPGARAEHASVHTTKRPPFHFDHRHRFDQVCDLKNCTSALFFEGRKKQDLYLWASKTPAGPSAKFLVQVGVVAASVGGRRRFADGWNRLVVGCAGPRTDCAPDQMHPTDSKPTDSKSQPNLNRIQPTHQNVHTMDELKLTGNHLKGSRPVLSFDAAFDTEPHLQLIKEMFTQVGGLALCRRSRQLAAVAAFSLSRLSRRPKLDHPTHPAALPIHPPPRSSPPRAATTSPSPFSTTSSPSPTPTGACGSGTTRWVSLG